MVKSGFVRGVLVVMVVALLLGLFVVPAKAEDVVEPKPLPAVYIPVVLVRFGGTGQVGAICTGSTCAPVIPICEGYGCPDPSMPPPETPVAPEPTATPVPAP